MIFVYWEWWISIEATKICYFGLPLSGIGSKPIRLSDVLNLKNLKTIWGIKLIFASIEGTKNVILFWIMLDNTLGQSVYRIFYFWLVWLFNLNIGDPLLRCSYFLACLKISRKVFKHFDGYPLHVQQFLHNCIFSKYFTMILCNKNMTTKV